MAAKTSPKPQWHAFVCCDNDHGSSSTTVAIPMPTSDAVMADGSGSLSSCSSISVAPSASTTTSGLSATSASSAPSLQAKCPSPCPFETYCCLDEHCEADCKANKPKPQCEDKSCAEACFDPTCDDGCEAECCDDPSCEPEWCLEGCTIEEYLECCANACSEPPGDPLGLLPTVPAAAPLPTPPYFDIISAALAGQLITAPPPVPVAPPTFHAHNVCHWQNCHRTFETMQQLLAHLAADHLGAGPFDTSASAVSSTHPTPAAGHTPASHATPQTPIPPMGFDNMLAASHMTSTPVSVPSQGATGDLLSCLWDDCFPLDGFGVLDTSNQISQLQNQVHAGHPHPQPQPQPQPHAHPHPHPHSLHQHTHAATGEALSPQTMLRHLLEEHLGVVPTLVDPTSTSTSTSTSQPQLVNYNLTHGGHGHDHSGHSAHDHVHVHDGHEHTHPHGHAHAHPHAHTPRPKPYSRPASSLSRTKVASNPQPSQPQPHPHSHKHDHAHGPTRTPAHHHHVKFPLSPASSLASDPALICMWPGCTHHEPFTTTGDLMEHLSEEHVGRGRDKYRCLWDGCGGPEGRLFRSRQKVLRHLQSHTGHRPFVCHVCGQSFSEAAPLAAHLRRHSDDKPYVCDFPGCGKAFAISSSLTIHKRTHNGDKPFVCSYCGKGFVEASNLTKHIRTHTGERPFVCNHPDCGRAFSRPDQLKRHMLVHEAGRGRKNKEAVKKEAVAA